MKHIVIDLEMNKLAKQFKEERAILGREIIEIGAVVLDEEYQEIGSFKTLVKPQYNDVIEKGISKLTGITTEQVKNAPVLEEAIQIFFAWCHSMEDEIIIHEWSDADLDQLTKEISLKKISLLGKDAFLLEGWSDFQREYGEKLHLDNQVSLKNAVMYAGIDFEGHEHDALDDARNTAELLKIVRTPSLCESALQHIIEVLTPTPTCSAALGDLFDFGALGLSA